jgi:hypothetical protein
MAAAEMRSFHRRSAVDRSYGLGASPDVKCGCRVAVLDTEVISVFMLIAGLSAVVFNRFFGCVGVYWHVPRPNDLREARSLEGTLGSTAKAVGVAFMLLGLCNIHLPRFSPGAELGGALKPALLLVGLGSLMNAGFFLGRLRATAVSLTKEQFQDL